MSPLTKELIKGGLDDLGAKLWALSPEIKAMQREYEAAERRAMDELFCPVDIQLQNEDD